LLLCGENVEENFRERVVSRLDSRGYFGSVEVFSEVPSEFMTTFMALELAQLLRISVHTKEVTDWLLGFSNGDGGFGPQEKSNLNSTYHAVASLSC